MPMKIRNKRKDDDMVHIRVPRATHKKIRIYAAAHECDTVGEAVDRKFADVKET